MESGELIDELREGGLREVWFYWQKIETDVEFEPLTEWLVMDEKGVILARKVAPPRGRDWTLLYGAGRPALFPLPGNAIQYDLADKESVVAEMDFFGDLI